MGRFNTSPRNDRFTEQNNDWQATAYVNVYLPYKKADGTPGKHKIGGRGLPITEKGADAKLADMFKKDPEAFKKMLAEHMIIDVQAADGGKSNIEFAFAI